MPNPTYNEVVNLINGNLANFSNIMPVEHRQVEKAILDYTKTSIDELEQNISGQIEVLADLYIQLSDHHDEYPTGGGLNFGSAERLAGTVNDARYKINYQDPLTGNYFVILSNESRGGASQSWNDDNDIILTYKNAESNSIEVLLRETGSNVQNIRVHVTIVKY